MDKKLGSNKTMISSKQKTKIKTKKEVSAKKSKNPTSFLLHSTDINRLNNITSEVDSLAVGNISKTQIIRGLIAIGETIKKDKLLDVIKDNL